MKEKDTSNNLGPATGSSDLVANTESIMPAIEKALDTERQKDADIILLRNWDKLTGTVMNEKFSMKTSYAHVDVKTNYIAEIDLEGVENNMESIITVNNNRFSGLIDDDFINFKLTNGSELEIRREKVLKIIFRQRPQETAGMKWGQFVQLKNGDYFHGQILTKDIMISTTYAKIPLDFATVESITLIGESNPQKIVKMTNGDTIQGTLETENIQVELDVGSVIEVYQDRIERIFIKEGYIPDGIPPIFMSSSATKGSLVLVEKGSFTMGDTCGDGARDEKPTHKVTLTYNFYIGKYEVTFEEYDAFCEAAGKSEPSDGGWGGGTKPAISVNWFDVTEYCNWLSERERLPKAYDEKGNLLDKGGRVTTDPSKVAGYRLPTEAEWEYAARGGNRSKGYKYSGSNIVDDVAWYRRNSGDEYLTDERDVDKFIGCNCKTHEVGKKAPNELGIYDMSGNVQEWCSDWYGRYSSLSQINPYNNSGSARVLRGGCYEAVASETTVSTRTFCKPDLRGFFMGFRICKTL